MASRHHMSRAARGTVLDPAARGDWRSKSGWCFSGYPSVRSYSALPAMTGVLADWRSIVLILQSSLWVTVDKVTYPDHVRITSRLSVADPVVTRPARVYRLTQE